MSILNPDGGRRPRWLTGAAPADSGQAHQPGQASRGQGPQAARAAQERRRLAERLARRREPDAVVAGEDPASEFVAVRIQWAETTRYEADFYLSPYSTDAELWQEIGMVGEWERTTLDIADSDNRIVSIVDLDGDRRASVLERAISAGNIVGRRYEWGDLADSIDERLAESADWPALSAALDRAAASGYDVGANLPRLAAEHPLPDRHPARELHYRLMGDCDAALAAGDAGAATGDTDTDTGTGSGKPDVGPPAMPYDRGAPPR
jgi:hypothetical protein